MSTIVYDVNARCHKNLPQFTTFTTKNATEFQQYLLRDQFDLVCLIHIMYSLNIY